MDQQTALTNKTSTPKITLTSALILQELLSFLQWWYLEVPTWYIAFFQRVILICDDTLSISLLLKTFFTPWHRDYSMTGRLFGIAIRIIYIPLAVLITLAVIAIMISIAVTWAILPFLTLFSIIRSPFIS